MSYVYLSNHTEQLADIMSENLLKGGFRRTLIVTDSPSTKRFVVHRMAKYHEIAMGMQWMSLFSAAGYLLKLIRRDDEKPFPSAACIALGLLCEFDEISLSSQFGGFFQSNQKRKVHFCEKLGRELYELNLYGGDRKWDEAWKQSLWEYVFEKWLCFDELKGGALPFEMDIHLFDIDFMPLPFYRFFDQLPGVHYYLFSPTLQYWEDLCSERKRAHLWKFYEKKGAKREQLAALDMFVKNRNRLVANWGTYGQSLPSLISASEYETFESYREVSEGDVLSSLQNDFLLMRDPHHEEIIREIAPGDRSLCFFEHASPLREVEGIYHAILESMENDPTLSPDDVLILAPDISLFTPYIDFVFGDESSLLDYRISDMEVKWQSKSLSCLSHLFHLIESRWEMKEIVKLFSFEAFTKACRISNEDAAVIRGWIERSSVRFGFDQAHYLEIMGKDGEITGTWELLFKHLVFGLAFPFPVSHLLKEEVEASFYPELTLDFSSSDLLSTFIGTLKTLYEDLKVFKREEMHVADWLLYLEGFIKMYVSIPEGESAIFEDFKRNLRSMNIIDKPVSFSQLQPFIEGLFSKKSASRYGSSITSVHFGSVREGSVYPAKIIAFIGLDEVSFPTPTKDPKWLCTASSHPKNCERQRYVILKGMLSAKSHCFFSHCFQSPSDGKEQGPSMIIEDLKEYLGKAYKDIDVLTVKHPALSFHEMYFQGGLKNYSQRDFKAYRALHGEKKPISRKIVKKTIEKPTQISVRELCRLAKNPFEFYFQQTLQIYLSRKEDVFQRESDEFILSPLQKTILQKASVLSSSEKLIPTLREGGKLPRELFGEVAINSVEKEHQKLALAMQNLKISKEDLFTLHLDLHSSAILEKAREKRLPAVIVEGVQIYGKIENVSQKGLIIFGKGDFSEQVKWWPTLILLHLIAETIPLKPQLIFLQTEKIVNIPLKDPLVTMKNYLRYFSQSLESLSPLHPKWAKALFFEDEGSFQKCVKNHINQSMRFGYDPYTLWAFQGRHALSPKKMFQDWAPRLKESFEDLLLGASDVI